jgi:chemotaxis protein MotB
MQPEASAFEQIALAVRAKMQRTTDENPELKDLAANVRVAVTEDGLLITIIEGGKDLMFDSSSSELKPRLVALLELLAPIVAQLDNQVQVHGHTDARAFPKGSNRSNWQLSFERADNARAVLDRAGLRKGQVSGVFAHGEAALINTKEPFAPENRRLALLAVRRGLEKVATRGQKLVESTESKGTPMPPKKAAPEKQIGQ